MLTPARAAISRVEAPWNPFAANTSSAAARMRAFVDPGASRAFSSADLTTRTGDSIDRPRSAYRGDCRLSTRPHWTLLVELRRAVHPERARTGQVGPTVDGAVARPRDA